ncbi:2-dehydro-3-deoxy-6-phosphogalactonate aldolase [Phenylobacterium sp. J426]|uniref:2-dehydro-3-deoxy-6-phosphogalactonate aldolase n=1 Tax=Phenylobacterium sp. J426 TaxID=2898439 RepID=UPI002151400F|nr:2-dehydro-3-deoxy-6-phosphogalactonate aldolase [Phenylobacterium sp. J426]MCR5876123.1 2-dehydro-3-deoxy-6-phosphogalactonate aldolase [Phenylobacterium sp. J426]
MKLEAALAEAPVVAIVRGVRPDEILDHAQALFEAGVRGVEVPLNSPEPLDSIRALAETFADRMAVGAGTVLTPERVEAVAEAGGRIIVSPNTQPEVIRRAVELGLDPAPGFATATEAFTAIEAGARHLKLFPAVTYGPAHLKQLKAVLPADVTVWAVGGVGPDGMADWWAAGARAFGLGGELYKAGQSPAETAEKAARVMAAVRRLA